MKIKYCTIIAAVAQNDVIGMEGKLPWHLPSDLRWFNEYIAGKTLLMGRRTYECLPPSKLPKSDLIVLTRNLHPPAIPRVRYAHSIKEALKMDRACGDLFVIGGTAVYAEAMPYARWMRITRVNAKPEGDTLFPDFGCEWDLENTPHFEKRHPKDQYETAQEKWIRYV